MCAIFGAYGRRINAVVLDRIRDRARDRGRDGGGMETTSFDNGYTATLGAWRATPTTEMEVAPPQPYGGIVHNGTIANDAALGNPAGMVDSMVLQHVLDRRSLEDLVASLRRVVGSYALGIIGPDRLYLAANYKPIHYGLIDNTLYFASMERHLAAEMPWGTRPQRLKPYTALDCRSGKIAPLPREHSGRALVIASGGLDSTTAAYLLREQGYEVSLLHFNYGCHATAREVTRVKLIAQAMQVPFRVVPIDYGLLRGASPLLATERDIAAGVQGAEFAHEWVPGRNLLMVATAVAYAEANGIDVVALGNNLEESGAYPDNEEQFTTLLNECLDFAVHDGGQVRLLAPVGKLMKHEIVREGLRLRVPYELTWSCYRGGTHHCGKCGPCWIRREAFIRNHAIDPVFERSFTAEPVLG
jgi:7-cyano-7-deazaguanine synthase